MKKLLSTPDFSLYVSYRRADESREDGKSRLYRDARMDYLGSASDAEVIRLPSGAPAYSDGACMVSYSDKDALMAVVLSHSPIGVDAERLSPRDYSGVARRFFNRDDMTLREFYEAWTAAEALAKRDGDGIIPYRVRSGRLTTIEYDGYLITVAEQ